MRYSACQPSSLRRVARSQILFHAGLKASVLWASLLTVQSFRWPPGVVLKATAFCRSPKVSRTTFTKSPGASSSRIIELARTPPGMLLRGVDHDLERLVIVRDPGHGALGRAPARPRGQVHGERQAAPRTARPGHRSGRRGRSAGEARQPRTATRSAGVRRRGSCRRHRPVTAPAAGPLRSRPGPLAAVFSSVTGGIGAPHQPGSRDAHRAADHRQQRHLLAADTRRAPARPAE